MNIKNSISYCKSIFNKVNIDNFTSSTLFHEFK